MKNRFLMFILGGIIIFFLLCPSVVNRGAKTGLILWFYTVIPALLPFMIFSGFLIKQNITYLISKMTKNIFGKIFGISQNACFPVVIGLLSGYPLGAKNVAQIYENKMISKKEAQYLLSFCNNASPMFLVEFIGVQCLKMKYPITVLAIIYVSGWIGSLFSRREMEKNNICMSERKTNHVSWIQSLDDSIIDSFYTIFKVGGYIILFSILGSIVEKYLPADIRAKYIGMSILEITTGGALLAKVEMSKWLFGGIYLSVCAFGGVSSVFQTASVIGKTDLSIKDYVVAKIRQSVVAFVLGSTFFGVF